MCARRVTFAIAPPVASGSRDRTSSQSGAAVAHSILDRASQVRVLPLTDFRLARRSRGECDFRTGPGFANCGSVPSSQSGAAVAHSILDRASQVRALPPTDFGLARNSSRGARNFRTGPGFAELRGMRGSRDWCGDSGPRAKPDSRISITRVTAGERGSRDRAGPAPRAGPDVRRALAATNPQARSGKS